MIQLGPPSNRHPAENLAQISKNAPKEIKANRVALSEIRLKRPRSKHHLEAGFAEISRGSSNPAVSRRAVCKGCAMRKETTLPDIIRRLGSRPVSPSCVNPFGQTNSGITICLVKNRDTLALCPLRADTPTSRLPHRSTGPASPCGPRRADQNCPPRSNAALGQLGNCVRVILGVGEGICDGAGSIDRHHGRRYLALVVADEMRTTTTPKGNNNRAGSAYAVGCAATRYISS